MKIYLKKYLLIFNFFTLIFLAFLIKINNIQNLDFEDSNHTSDKIFDTEENIEQYLINLYGDKENFSFSYEDKTGVLSIRNVRQRSLKEKYNSLGNKRYDLNKDNVIDDNDNFSAEAGVCQPTAAAMVLRYLALCNTISYEPKLNSDLKDINNVFYEILYDYINNGWDGDGALRSLCKKSLNSFFDRNNINFKAYYSSVNLLYFIESSHAKSIPAIGHIESKNGGHAVAIGGFFTIKVKYSGNWLEGNVLKIYRYAVITTGWTDSTLPDVGAGSLEDYYSNYSYIDVEDLAGITYII